MPKCERCSKSVTSYDLKFIRDGEKTLLACSNCRKPEEVTGSHPEDKQIAAISLHQYETAEGKKDYRVEAAVKAQGLDINYQFSFEDARKFFKEGTKKRAELKAV